MASSAAEKERDGVEDSPGFRVLSPEEAQKLGRGMVDVSYFIRKLDQLQNGDQVAVAIGSIAEEIGEPDLNANQVKRRLRAAAAALSLAIEIDEVERPGMVVFEVFFRRKHPRFIPMR